MGKRMSKWNELQGFIQKADHVLIVSHLNPDGDAISSTLAMGRLLSQFGKKITMMNESGVPDRFLYLDGADAICCPHDVQSKFQYVVTVDCADIDRVGKSRSVFTENAQIVNIDHHKTNDHYGSLNMVDSDAASTTQVLYNLIKSAGIEVDLSLAKMIYTGLVTDTGGFRYSNTTAKVMRMAAELIEIGVNPYEIADLAIESISSEYIRLLQTALSSLRVSDDGRVSWIALSYKDLESFRDVDFEDLVQYTRNIIGVEVGFFLRETEERRVKVSFRSKALFDVATLAQYFGGGGHARASGCTIEGSIEEAQAIILEKLSSELGRTSV